MDFINMQSEHRNRVPVKFTQTTPTLNVWTLLVLISIFCLTSCATPATPTRHYPPYPDVWEWSPEKEPIQSAHVSLKKLPDGEILITHIGDFGAASTHQYAGFFSRMSFDNVKNIDELHRPTEGQDSRRLVLPNGKVVLGLPSANCARGTGALFIVYADNTQQQELARKTVIVERERPKEEDEIVCEESLQGGFSHSTAIFEPGGLLLLDDATFLAWDLGTGIVIRLDENLNSKSRWLGRRLSIVDPTTLDNLLRKVSRESTEPRSDMWRQFFSELRDVVTDNQ